MQERHHSKFAWGFAAVFGLMFIQSIEISFAELPPQTVDDRDIAKKTIGRVVESMDKRIWCIHKDQSGNIWFGSNGSGIYRYDGNQVVRITTDHGLAGNQIRSIVEDKHGNLFFSTTDGVSKFDGQSLKTLEPVEATSKNDRWVLDPDDVWFVIQPGEHGPFRYDGKTLYQLALTKSPAEKTIDPRFANPQFPATGLYSIYKDRNGHLWFGTAGAGLCRFDGKTLSWMYEKRLTTTLSGGEFGIRSIFQDSNDDYWICNTRQRFEMSSKSTVKDDVRLIEYVKQPGLPAADSDTAANFTYFPSVTEDREGNLWMACGSDGVWKFDGEHVAKHALGDNVYAICIYLDNRDRIWVSTLEDGVFILEHDEFKPFNPFDK